jgi:outer membrane protein assembly factor BamB
MGDLEPVWEYKTDDNVWAACLSRDGQLLVLGSWDSIAYALDRSGEVVWRHKTSDYVKGISISDDGELTVVGSYDRYIYELR